MSRSHPDNLPEPSDKRRPARCQGGLFQADLKAHLDGEMSAFRNWLVRWHLARCTECREELRWLRRLGEDMKDIESARPRPELRARIMANLPLTPPAPGIQVVHSRPERESASRLAPRLALAGGFAMLLAFSTVFALKRTSDAAAGTLGGRAVAQNKGKETPAASDAANDRAKEMNALVGYTPAEDPNNKLADRMFHEEMAEQEREKRLQGQDDWNRLMTQARTIARKTSSPANAEMGVALTVADISLVRAHLPSWAKQEGVKMVAGDSPASEGSESSLPVHTTPSGLVAFYVPAERGPKFLGALKQLGQISILPSAPKVIAEHRSPKLDVRVEMSLDAQGKPVPMAPGNAEAGAPAEKVAVVHEKPAKAIRYLILTVLLQSAVHN